MWEAAAGTALANVASTVMTNQANKKAAQKQMDFQQYNSDTAHQREVKDLRAAGLNPILSANAGASSPAGAAETNVAPQVDPLLFANAKQAQATRKNTIADTGLKAANTKGAEESIKTAKITQDLLRAQAAKEGELARGAKQEADLTDKYGNAQRIMGLVQSGTGSIGNLMSIGNAVKNLGDLFNPRTGQTIENYSPSGEHMGTKSIRYNRRK